MADVNTALSSNDAKVLSAIFDPESSPSTSVKIKSDGQKLPHVPDALLPSLQLTERDAIRSLGTSTRPDQKDIKSAIDSLSLLIERNPQYASAYMNRAQAIRLLIDDEGDFFHARNLEITSALFGDLAKCIRLLSPKSPQDAVSPLQARLLATSHTHRGYLFLKAAKAAGRGTLEAGPDEVKGKDRDELEERASREFYAGGMYGDEMAKQMAVKTNPYARLCGAIVKQALKQDE